MTIPQFVTLAYRDVSSASKNRFYLSSVLHPAMFPFFTDKYSGDLVFFHLVWTYLSRASLTIDATQNTLGESQIILYIMTSQMYKSKLFCTSQIILYIPNYFIHFKFFYIFQINIYIFQKVLLIVTWGDCHLR